MRHSPEEIRFHAQQFAEGIASAFDAAGLPRQPGVIDLVIEIVKLRMESGEDFDLDELCRMVAERLETN